MIIPIPLRRVTSAFTIILIIVGLFNCNQPKKKEEPPKRPDPNIGGLGMPRGLVNKTAEATPGYVLFSPLSSDTTYLVNTEGEVVHIWKSDFGPSGWVYLKNNGNLLRGGRQPDAPVYGGGGQGGRLQEFNWDGELLWDYKLADESQLPHHDISILPNGNLLVLAWESMTPEAARAMGRNSETIPKAGLWPDKIVEIKPLGKNDAKIVWEWHISDRLIQNLDSTKKNFAIPSEHPELLDFNLGGPLEVVTQKQIDEARANNQAVTNSTVDNSGSDLYHVNSIDYNADLDQIVISSPGLDEILIIDHGTTTVQAAAHSGGRWGKGGDFLYRWGNPKNYGAGDSTNHAIGGQHDVKWIPKGYPGEGNLMLFNNHVPNSKKPFSAVYELAVPVGAKGYELTPDKRYGPEKPVWSFVAADTISAFAPFISGAHRMQNGNTFITIGPKGRFLEVNTEGKILWDYWTPYSGYVKMKDGTSPQPIGPLVYATFRATHIPTDHPAVKGKTLQPLTPQPNHFHEVKKK